MPAEIHYSWARDALFGAVAGIMLGATLPCG
jgi:hypothetical protein